MTTAPPSILATVSSRLVEDWVMAMRTCCGEVELASFLQRAGIHARNGQLLHRVTLDQIVRLYQIAAVETEDEMMGLWSRPIRSRALQHLLTTVREASSLPAAVYRFSTFWNLLLDDYRFEVTTPKDRITLHLVARDNAPVQRFGHMLILKLAHGLLSWLSGSEVPVLAVQFAFTRPKFAEDYTVIFPTRVDFGADNSAISFDLHDLGTPGLRSAAEMKSFLARAPRDWIFTSIYEHSQSLKVREFMFRTDWGDCRLVGAAQDMGITPRTLIRRLDAEETSFQAIKDGLRRDLAIRDLQAGDKSIEEISHDLGFSSAANFHRAFRKWTGTTPRSYRDNQAGEGARIGNLCQNRLLP